MQAMVHRTASKKLERESRSRSKKEAQTAASLFLHLGMKEQAASDLVRF
jgi:hypothetical protein